jgi:hypothetical protein
MTQEKPTRPGLVWGDEEQVEGGASSLLVYRDRTEAWRVDGKPLVPEDPKSDTGSANCCSPVREKSDMIFCLIGLHVSLDQREVIVTFYYTKVVGNVILHVRRTTLNAVIPFYKLTGRF